MLLSVIRVPIVHMWIMGAGNQTRWVQVCLSCNHPLQSRRCVSVKGKPESPFTQRPAVQNMDRCVCPTLCRAGHANARLLFNKRIRTRGAIPLSDDEVPPHRGCTTIHIHTQLIYHMPQNNTRANEQISPPKTKSATLRQAARCFARNVRVFPTCCEIPP